MHLVQLIPTKMYNRRSGLEDTIRLEVLEDLLIKRVIQIQVCNIYKGFHDL